MAITAGCCGGVQEVSSLSIATGCVCGVAEVSSRITTGCVVECSALGVTTRLCWVALLQAARQAHTNTRHGVACGRRAEYRPCRVSTHIAFAAVTSARIMQGVRSAAVTLPNPLVLPSKCHTHKHTNPKPKSTQTHKQTQTQGDPPAAGRLP